MTKLLFMDVDGTLTDGKIYMGDKGEIMKAFHVRDGYAVKQILPQYDMIPVIITGRESEIVSQRCRELGIGQIYQGISLKEEKMLSVAKEYGICLNEKGILPHTAYIGDDIPDLECMLIAEKKGSPADAVDRIKENADFVSGKIGGDGAVREFIEWICRT